MHPVQLPPSVILLDSSRQPEIIIVTCIKNNEDFKSEQIHFLAIELTIDFRFRAQQMPIYNICAEQFLIFPLFSIIRADLDGLAIQQNVSIIQYCPPQMSSNST
jgi:hypothetical protein